MASPLYPAFEKRIDDSTKRIIRDQVTPWAFLKAEPKFSVKRFDGSEISYQGGLYEGSPQDVFWRGYIDPFLEAMAMEEIGHAVSLATERKVDLKILLPEVEGLLLSAARKIFDRMADIDRRLRGNGFPESLSIRSTEAEYNSIHAFISNHVKAELVMWKPKSRLEEWYERNKFLAWLINTLIAISGLLIALASFSTKLFKPQ